MYLQRWHDWCHMKLQPSRRVLCTPYNHAPCHFMQSHIRKVYARLAVTCQLHFWQNDRDLFRATAVTLGGTDTEMSQQRKSTLDKNLCSDRIIILRMISDAPSVMILIIFYHCIKNKIKWKSILFETTSQGCRRRILA